MKGLFAGFLIGSLLIGAMKLGDETRIILEIVGAVVSAILGVLGNNEYRKRKDRKSKGG